MSVSDFDEMTCAFGRCLCSKVLRAYRRQPISNRSCCRDRPIRCQRPPATCRCITACCRQHNTLASGNTHRDASSAFQWILKCYLLSSNQIQASLVCLMQTSCVCTARPLASSRHRVQSRCRFPERPPPAALSQSQASSAQVSQPSSVCV